jgi:hypothetical protein
VTPSCCSNASVPGSKRLRARCSSARRSTRSTRTRSRASRRPRRRFRPRVDPPVGALRRLRASPPRRICAAAARSAIQGSRRWARRSDRAEPDGSATGASEASSLRPQTVPRQARGDRDSRRVWARGDFYARAARTGGAARARDSDGRREITYDARLVGAIASPPIRDAAPRAPSSRPMTSRRRRRAVWRGHRNGSIRPHESPGCSRRDLARPHALHIRRGRPGVRCGAGAEARQVRSRRAAHGVRGRRRGSSRVACVAVRLLEGLAPARGSRQGQRGRSRWRPRSARPRDRSRSEDLGVARRRKHDQVHVVAIAPQVVGSRPFHSTGGKTPGMAALASTASTAGPSTSRPGRRRGLRHRRARRQVARRTGCRAAAR